MKDWIKLSPYEDARYYEDIKGFVKRRFPEEFATYQIKDGVTFQQARDALNVGMMKDAICADVCMDTALRHKIWIGFKECFGIDEQTLEEEYFKDIRPKKINLPKGELL